MLSTQVHNLYNITKSDGYISLHHVQRVLGIGHGNLYTPLTAPAPSNPNIYQQKGIYLG